MTLEKTDIAGLYIVHPKVFGDSRGYFFESFSARDFSAALLEERAADGLPAQPVPVFVQDNESMSRAGVIRGLHFQCPPFAQSKLVRCVRGTVLDVAVDIRRGSPSYGRSVAVELSEDNHLQLFLPKGMAHGFAVLSDTAVFQYKCDEYYHPESEGGISVFDPALGIDWRIDPATALLSDKDRVRPTLTGLDSPFEY